MRAQELGVRIKRLRQRAGLTLRELADKVGIDFTYLSKIENGTVTAPSEAVISKLAEALRANREELLILAGKVPPDIVQMLKEQGVIRHLRTTRTRKIAREVRREKITALIGRFTRPLKNIPRVAIPIALVVTLAASVWFASPVKAVDTTLVDLPATMSRGSTQNFYAQVDINTNEAIPITNLRIDINGPSPVWVEFDADGNITSQSSGSNFTSITPQTAPHYGYGYRYGYGYGYQPSTGYDYSEHWWGWGYGHGYGYYGTGTTQLRFLVVLDTTGMSTGAYTAQLAVNVPPAPNKFLSVEYAFSISGGGGMGGGGGPVMPTYCADLLNMVDFFGLFLRDVTVQSADGNCTLLVSEGITGLQEYGMPLIRLCLPRMLEPPAIPRDIEAIGSVYDIEPNRGTFDPPATISITYDPLTLPTGVNERGLVIAVWNSTAGEWQELADSVANTETHTVQAPLGFTGPVTIFARPSTATFSLSNLSVSPDEVNIGGTVNISVLVTNTGDLSGSYEVTLRVEGTAVAAEQVTLEGSASQTVGFTTTGNAAGTYSVDVDGLSSSFTVREAGAQAPAAFTLSGLTITPAEANIGDTVTISVLVTNTGDLSGSYEVTLEIDGTVVGTEEVTLDGGASQFVSFTLLVDTAGIYSTNIAGLTSSFTVTEEGEEPPVTPDRPVGPNWWLISVIIAIVVTISVVVVFIIIRRRSLLT